MDSLLSSPDLCYQVSLVLLLAGGVGAGPQGESCVVVSQHGGYRFDVHAILEDQSGKGMTEIVGKAGRHFFGRGAETTGSMYTDVLFPMCRTCI